MHNPVQKMSHTVKVAIAAGVVLVALILAATFWMYRENGLLHSGSGQSKGATLNLISSRDKAVVSVLGELQLFYLDAGAQLQVRVIAEPRFMGDGSTGSHHEQVNDADPILYFDINHSHALDAGDLRYAVVGGASLVAERPDPSGSGLWLRVPTKATGSLSRVDGKTQVVWNIPRNEVTQSNLPADLALDCFHYLSQKSAIYPGPGIFDNVYRLMPSDGAATGGLPPPAPMHIPTNVGGGGEARAPTIRNFAVVPVSGDPRAGYKLLWQIDGAESAEIQPGLGSVGASGQIVVTPHTPTHYVLTARNHAGPVTRDLTVTPASIPPPQIAYFTSDAPRVATGSQTALRWRVDGEVTDIRIDAVGGGLPTQGNRVVTVERSMTFTLVAQGPGGAVSAQVPVQAEAVPAPGVSFSGRPQAIRSGQGVNLVWLVSDADKISIEPGIGPVAATGNITVHPSSNVRYMLVATGRGGTVSREVSIAVAHLPSASRGQIVWSGVVHGQTLITIDRDHADIGELQGALPGEACILQLPANNRNVSIASSPGPRNDYQRLILRVRGNGNVQVAIDWIIQ